MRPAKRAIPGRVAPDAVPTEPTVAIPNPISPRAIAISSAANSAIIPTVYPELRNKLVVNPVAPPTVD